MDKIKVLIVEDELLVGQALSTTLEEHNFTVLEVIDSGEETLDRIEKLNPDLILMDIQLAGDLDGIETTERLKATVDIPVIYLTDHTDDRTVERAKATFPVGYLSKPFKDNDVLRALEIAFFNASQKPDKNPTPLTDRVFIRTDNKQSEMIFYKDILYLEAGRAYCDIVTDKKKYTLSNNMGRVFEQFESPDFVKVHRSYIANINRITGIDGNMIKMGDDHTIQMSPGNREKVLQILKQIK